MSDKYIDITLKDSREEGTQIFSNLVDPLNLSILIDRIKDTKEKRTLEELVEDCLYGR